MRWGESVKHEARRLRRRGRTYSEINTQLGLNIPKSTLNGWFNGLVLPDFYEEKIKKINRISFRKAVRIARKVNKNKLESRLKVLREKNQHLLNLIDRDVGVLMLAMLYICEGSKYPTTRQVKFGSSHPGIMKLFIVLLRGCFNLDESKFRGRVHCRADQNIKFLERYWSNISDVPLDKFRKALIDKRTIGKPTKNINYKGVFVVSYFDTDIQLELQFLGEHLGKDGPVAQLVERLHGM